MKIKRILITGAAGLVGQNLTLKLKNREDLELICVDKHTENCRIFREINPEVKLIEENLVTGDKWIDHVRSGDVIVMNHAQIGGLTENHFVENNVIATQRVLDVAAERQVQHIIHISSSVVHSKASDFYTQSKTNQEKLVFESEVPSTILRPTLMFGWFDRKHLGWLFRFIKRSPFFPIPNFGKYIRQPLYVADFCSIIERCIDDPKPDQIFDISGLKKIYYVDLIKMLRHCSNSKALIIPIPYHSFWILLKIFALFSKKPPFTTQQLEALVIPEEFPVIDWPRIFEIEATPLGDAFETTFTHPEYAKIALKF